MFQTILHEGSKGSFELHKRKESGVSLISSKALSISADVLWGSCLTIIAWTSIWFVRVGAKSSQRITLSWGVALVQRKTGNEVRRDTFPCLAKVLLGAGVAVVTGSPISNLKTDTSSGLANITDGAAVEVVAA